MGERLFGFYLFPPRALRDALGKFLHGFGEQFFIAPF